jgi:threonine synthase
MSRDAELPTFTTHLECSLTGERFPADRPAGLSPAGRPLLVRYDLESLGRSLDRETLARRPGGFWRYAEFLPVRQARHRLDLGEVTTPLIHTPEPGAPDLWVKDEGRLPTGSFKARGLGVAVSMAKELGLTHLAMPTNGNAGAALAAYCRRGGLRATVFCPADTPEVNVREIALHGAEVHRVDGLIDACGWIVGEGRERVGWFDLSTLKEPYRIEGKKTMGLELAEQRGWKLPDAIFYPTGGGTGLIGMWKAFDELEALGWIGPERPRMFAVQAEGCAPIVRAFEAGEEHAEPWQDARTIAAGIRVPAAVGDFLILRAVRASGGAALAVSDEALLRSRAEFARDQGVLLCPEGAATHAAWRDAVKQGLVDAEASTVLFNCATGLKYPMPEADRTFDPRSEADWAALREAPESNPESS